MGSRAIVGKYRSRSSAETEGDEVSCRAGVNQSRPQATGPQAEETCTEKRRPPSSKPASSNIRETGQDPSGHVVKPRRPFSKGSSPKFLLQRRRPLSQSYRLCQPETLLKFGRMPSTPLLTRGKRDLHETARKLIEVIGKEWDKFMACKPDDYFVWPSTVAEEGENKLGRQDWPEIGLLKFWLYGW